MKKNRFTNREEAALMLTKKLGKYKGMDGIVLAVPRGGVPLGYTIARALGFPLEVVLSKKIGHPYNKEYAIGSVSLDSVIIDPDVDIPQFYIEDEIKKIRKLLQERYKQYMGSVQPAELKDKIVIITDDGIATGSTIMLTIDLIKKQHPQKIILAVPVAPFHTAYRLATRVDEMICLLLPEVFYGVGQFYEDFAQVEDEEVIALLREANQSRKAS